LRSIKPFLLFVMALLLGCSTKNDLDFTPATVDATATYALKINNATGQSVGQYNLVNITQQIAKNQGSDTYDYSTFVLRGKDKTTQADVYIVGRTSQSESYINITISQGGSIQFYKDCNNLSCSVVSGSNATGKYVRVTNFSSSCFTTTLDSDRRIDIVQFSIVLNPLTFYIPEN